MKTNEANLLSWTSPMTIIYRIIIGFRILCRRLRTRLEKAKCRRKFDKAKFTKFMFPVIPKIADFKMEDLASVQPMDGPSDCSIPVFVDFVSGKEERELTEKDLAKKLIAEYRLHAWRLPYPSCFPMLWLQREILVDGDIIAYAFDSGGWEAMAGRRGVCLVKSGRPVYSEITEMS